MSKPDLMIFFFACCDGIFIFQRPTVYSLSSLVLNLPTFGVVEDLVVPELQIFR